MISTRRGLEALAAITVLLAVVLVLDLRRERPVEDRSLAQGLDVESITALTWVRGDGAELHLVREGERWLWSKPIEAVADRGAVANVLATLRAARWHRTKPASEAGPTTTTLTISTAMPTTGGKPPEYADLPRRTLAIGAPLAGAEQAWIIDGDQALLVDAWVARALAPDPVTLVVRRPLDAVAHAAWIEVSDTTARIRIEGTPRRFVSPIVALVDAAVMKELHAEFAALEITSLAASAPPTATSDPVRIATPAGSVTIRRGCGGDPDKLLVSSPSGTGCVEVLPGVQALRVTSSVLRADPRSVTEPRPAPLDVASVTLGDGSILDVTRLRIGEHAADPVRITELLSVLAAPVTLAAIPENPRVTATLAVTDRHGATITLEVLAGLGVRRPGESLAMQVAPAAAAILERPGTSYRDLVPWVEDPLAVATIQIGQAFSSTRGAVVGEWSNPDKTSQQPWAPREVGVAIEALVELLAAPRPSAPGPATLTAARRVVLVVRPPTGDAVERTLEIGRATPAGCPARANGASLLLPRAVCDGVAALAGR